MRTRLTCVLPRVPHGSLRRSAFLCRCPFRCGTWIASPAITIACTHARSGLSLPARFDTGTTLGCCVPRGRSHAHSTSSPPLVPSRPMPLGTARPSHDLRQRLARGTMDRPLGGQHHEGMGGRQEHQNVRRVRRRGHLPAIAMPACALLPSPVWVTVRGTRPSQDGKVWYNTGASRLSTMEEVACSTRAPAG